MIPKHLSAHVLFICNVHNKLEDCSSNTLDTAGATKCCRQMDRLVDILISEGHLQWYLWGPNEVYI